MKLSLLRIIVCLLVLFAQNALAEDMYRCGNTYQDTPCKGGGSKPINKKPFKPSPVNNSSVSKKEIASNTPASAADADCKKQGEAAKLIIKLRDSGVTADEQIAIATDSAAVARIKDAYSRSGSAFQVQNAVERECLQQEQKTSLTSKWMAQAKRLLGFGTNSGAAPTHTVAKEKVKQKPISKTATTKPLPPQPTAQVEPQVAPAAMPEQSGPLAVIQPEVVAPTAPVAAAPDTPIAKPTVVATQPAPSAQKEESQDDPQGMCTSLKAGLKNIAEQKRKGGSAAMMKDLKAQQNNLEGVMKSAGC